MAAATTEGAYRRRVLSIGFYATCWILLSATAPLWIVSASIVGAVRRRSFVVLRLLTFGTFYFGFELLALVMVGWHVVRLSGDRERLEKRLVGLQTWWASMVLQVATRLLRLKISVEGLEEATRRPAMLLIRHASILDTLLPCALIQRPTRWPVRYILKRELLADPCLDIVGHILPNYFVDRGGDTQTELAAIARLSEGLGTDGMLIFPEGTRFSPEKRERAIKRVEREAPELVARARALNGVLPPKPGGVLTMLDALPDVDCVFVAHRGLESFAKIKNVLSGEVVGSTVHVWMWRVRSQDIPTSPDDRIAWLYDQWARVSLHVCEPTQPT
ncbi:MAG: lysophospholipid acyltransferase family protein [Myxococcota bacterium]